MRRLRTDSLCSYSGRSAQRAARAARGVELRPISKGMEAPSNPTVTVATTGAGLRPIPKGVEIPPDPNVTRTARLAATSGVIGQTSADGIVAKRLP